jgi:hypothetical protein
MTAAPTKEKRLTRAERAALSAQFDAEQEVRGRQLAEDWVQMEPSEALRIYVRWMAVGATMQKHHAFLLRVHELAQQSKD